MPNMDGTGPRFTGHGMGWGNGRRSGAGRSFAGCRCGFGLWAQNAPDAKTALEAQKNTLKRSLDSVEKRLAEL